MKNPHDGDFKDLAEDHPELLLRLLGILKPGEKTQIKNILRELRIEPVLIDHAYLIPKTSVEALILHVGCPVRGNSGTGVQFFQVFHKLNIFKRIAAPSRISQAPQP